MAEGLASTARVITAAALIMVFVFGSFVVADLRALKLIGLGLAVAVAIDATVVRIVLVPATMELLGDANWWLPRWLQRVVPRIRIEETHVDARAPTVERGRARRRRPLSLDPSFHSRRQPVRISALVDARTVSLPAARSVVRVWRAAGDQDRDLTLGPFLVLRVRRIGRDGAIPPPGALGPVTSRT